MKRTIGVIITVAGISTTYGQTEVPTKKWQPSNITIRLGSETIQNPRYESGNGNGFRSRSGATEEMINSEKFWATAYPDFQTTIPENFLGMDLEFKHYNSKKDKLIPGLKTRIGINYSQKNMESIRYYHKTNLSDKTFVDQNSLEEIIAVNQEEEEGKATFRTRELRLDASTLIHTSEERSLSFYTGIGIQLGGVINSDIKFHKNTRQGTFYALPDANTFQGGVFVTNGGLSGEIEEQSEKGDNYLTAGAYLPLGVNIKLSSKDHFLQRVSLNSEVRLGGNLTGQRNYLTTTITGGVRVEM